LFAKKGGDGGGPGGGGGDPPPPPVVQYQLNILGMPSDLGRIGGVWGMNRFGEVAGMYYDASNRRHAFLSSPTSPTTNVAIDLNLLNFDSEFDIPDGWYLANVYDVNIHGDVVGTMGKFGESIYEVRQGFVIKRSGEGKPKIIRLPDDLWTYAYAWQINDSGDIVGKFLDNVTGVRGIYLFNPELYDDSEPLPPIILDNVANGYLNNSGQVAGLLGQGVAFRYTPGASEPLEEFPEILSVDSAASVLDINDVGEFCGSVLYKTDGKGRARKRAYRHGTQLEAFTETGNAAAAINVAGDFPMSRVRQFYHEGTGLITLDENVVVGDEVDLFMIASSFDPRDVTERGAMIGSAPEFPGICGTFVISGLVDELAFVLVPVPAP
jgi:hypothetical protein